MNKSQIKHCLAPLYQRLSEKYDMGKHEIMELRLSTCVDANEKPFIAAECTIVNKKTMDSYLVNIDMPLWKR